MPASLDPTSSDRCPSHRRFCDIADSILVLGRVSMCPESPSKEIRYIAIGYRLDGSSSITIELDYILQDIS